jgi:hypothetical protein
MNTPYKILLAEANAIDAEIGGIDAGLKPKRGRSKRTLKARMAEIQEALDMLKPLADGYPYGPAMSDAELPVERLLPAPRLQLVWRQHDDPQYDWICEYVLVMSQGEEARLDVRNTGGSNGDGNAPDRVAWLLGYTRCGRSGQSPVIPSGSHWTRTETIQTPYRDGAHIMWDSKKLGIPAYVVCGDKAQQLPNADYENSDHPGKYGTNRPPIIEVTMNTPYSCTPDDDRV